jgi:hypothetical protein
MNGNRRWGTFVLLLILSMVAPVSAAPIPQAEPIGEPAKTTASVAQEIEVKPYLLQLDMPEVNVAEKTPPADVPGVYYSALYRRWTEVEGVLKALQAQRLVADYTLLPEANAFSIAAQPAAEEQLARLGALSEPGLMIRSAEAEATQFQARLDAAIQATQQDVTLTRPTEERPVAPEERPEREAPPPRDYRVELTAADEMTAAQQRHELVRYFERLQGLDEVQSYEWMPEANGFRVSAQGDLGSLRDRPEVDQVTPEGRSGSKEDRPPASRAPAGVLDTGGPDAYGYHWIDSDEPGGPAYDWIDAMSLGTNSGLYGGDVCIGPVDIGFTFPFYENSYTELHFSTKGLISFGQGTVAWDNTALPYPDTPNNIIVPFWDDLGMYSGSRPDSGIFIYRGGTSPNRYFAIEWYRADAYSGPGPNGSQAADLTFEAILYENGDILMQYLNMDGNLDSASVGIEDDVGMTGLEYSRTVSNNLAVLFHLVDFKWDPHSQHSYATPGETVHYTTTLWNKTGAADTYTVTASGNTWPTTVWDESFGAQITNTGPIAHDASVTVGVSVTVPLGTPGESDEAILRATSWASPTEYAEAAVRTSVPITPTVRVDKYTDLDAWGQAVENAPVNLTLKNSSGATKATASTTSEWDGDFYVYHWDWSCPAGCSGLYYDTGDTLYVEAGLTTTLAIPELTALVDRDADTVSGQAPPNISSTNPYTLPILYAWVQGANRHTGWWQMVDKFITTDASGHYSTVFTYTNPTTATLDLHPPHTYGYLRYVDAQGNQVSLYYHAPEVGVQSYNDWVNGNAGMPRVAVTVTLKSSTGAVKGQFDGNADYYGWFGEGLRDIYDNASRSMPGDVVEMVSESGASVSVPVVELTALADHVADTVTGVGPPNIAVTYTNYITLPGLRVDVWGPSPSPEQWVTTDGDGNYIADDVGDFSPGEDGEILYYNENGDRVYHPFRAPIVYVRGRPYEYEADNYVSGYAAIANALVRLHLKRGGAVVATAYDMATYDGYYGVWFHDAFGNAVNIQGGDAVEVIAGGSTITVDVPDFDVVSDPDEDRVVGATDATVITDTYGLTQTLAVWPTSTYDWDYGKYVTEEITGTLAGFFVAENPFYDEANPDWGWTDLDWGPGQQGHLRYTDAGGNQVYDDFAAEEEEFAKPVVYVRGSYWNNRYYSDNYVSGNVSGCGDVSVVLKHGAAIKAQTTFYDCWEWGVYLYDIYGNPVAIEAGDTVAVTFEGQTTEVDVPDFDVVSDPNEDRVVGTTDAAVVTDTYGLTQTLAVWPTSTYDSSYGKYVMEQVMGTLAGFFVAENPFYEEANPDWGWADLDWYPGQQGHLRYVDANGNRVYDDFQAEYPPQVTKPVVYVRGLWCGCGCDYYHNENYVGGHVPGVGYSSYANVTAVLKDGTGSVKDTRTDNTCYSGRFDFYFSENIEPGDTVEVTYGDQTTIVEVPTFDVTSDSAVDAVYGVTDADVVTDTYGMTRTLAVWPTSTRDWDYGKYVLPDAGGTFTATNPFYDEANPNWWSTNLNWSPGTYGHLRYVDADANRVYARFVAPREEPEIYVHKDNNYVSGYVTDSESPLTVTLKTSDTVRARAYTTADFDGWFEADFWTGIGLPILIEQGDDVIVETPHMAPITVPVVPLTGQVDVNAETVSGEGPANDLVNVILYDAGWSWIADQSATTDASGAYSADFMGVADIQPGNPVEVRHRNADGHTVYIQVYAGPKLYAQLNSYYAWGYSVAANSPVTLTLRDTDSTIKGSGTDFSDWNNEFSAYLYSATGQRAIIEAGDVLEADFGNGAVVSMTVAGLTADVDADTDAISGTGPANDHLGVSVGNFNETVPTDGDGKWSADASGKEDITPGEQVLVRHINADDHETWLYGVAPVVYVRATGSGSTAYQADNYVSGYASRRAVVNVTLKDGSGATITSRRVVADSGNGYYATYLNDALGLDADIQGGDEVIVSPSPEATVDVPEIDAEVDADTNTITGATSITDDYLGVYVNGYNQTVHTDASGVFTATFPAINPGNAAYVRYHNEHGHWIHARFQAESAGDVRIYARWDGGELCNNCASGYASASNIVATVALKRDGSTIATATGWTDSYRWFNVMFTDAAGEDVDIVQGDVIEVSASEPVSMTVEAITVEADAEADRLYGTGPAGGQLQIEGDCWGNTTITDDGTWWFACGLYAGSYGYLYYTQPDDHRTYLGWAVPLVRVHENGNYVGGTVKRGMPVTVTLQNSRGAERAVETTTSDRANGWFRVNFQDGAGDPIIIQPNDTVVVQASPAIIVPVTPLSAEMDPVNDEVTGSGPAGKDLEVWIYKAGDWHYRPVTVDGSGAYTADFSGEIDAQAGDEIWVSYWNEEGNLVYIDFNAPMVRVNAVNNIVDGYATPNATAQLTLQQSGVATPTTTSASTGINGWFSAFFTDADGNVVDIQAGDTVQVTASPAVDVDVADLSASVNAGADTVTGTGPADSLLLVKAFSEGGGWWRSKSVTTDGNGDFAASFAGEMDLTVGSYVYVRYSDANGNQSSIHTTPTHSPLLNAAEQRVEDHGATVETSTFNAANGGDLTPPITYQGGGQKLVFASEGGSLILTRPDGSVDDSDSTWIVVEGAPEGLWQVQVRLWGGSGDEGEQYAVAIGKAEVKYDLYLPLVLRNAGR